MTRALLICSLLIGCTSRELAAVAPAPLGVDFPACRALALGTPLAFRVKSEDARPMTLQVSVIGPQGTLRITSREPLAARSELRVEIPPEALAQGLSRCELRVAVDGGEFDAANYTVDVVRPNTALSDADMDGDCYSPSMGDCDDTRADTYSHAPESCEDGIDNDCNGVRDGEEPACLQACPDRDGDGAASHVCGGADCDDRDPFVRPGGTELCNGRDDDCDGNIDEAFDKDGDTFIRCDDGAPPTMRTDGSPCPDGYSSCADCDDFDHDIYPGPTALVRGSCGNGILDAGEECEDANTQSGDGCDADCQAECLGSDLPPNARRVAAKEPTSASCFLLLRDPYFFVDGLAQCRALLGPRARAASLATNITRRFVTTGPLAPYIRDETYGYSGGQTRAVFIGLSDELSEGSFVWSDGTRFTPSGWQWAAEQPDNGGPGGNNDCVVINGLPTGMDPKPAIFDRSCVGDVGGILCERTAATPVCPPP